MNTKTRILVCLLCLVTTTIFAQKVNIQSVDGTVSFSFYIVDGNPMYSVKFWNEPIIKNSLLQVDFNNGGPLQNVEIINNPLVDAVHNEYDLVIGKTKYVDDYYSTATIELAEKGENNRKLNIEVRVFNDGLAFRYIFPKQDGDSLIVHDENTEFNFLNNPKSKVLYRINYTTSHEGLYTTLPVSELYSDSLIDMPATFDFSNKVYAAVTEAALLDYAGMYLIKENGKLRSKLSPYPNRINTKVVSTFPHSSPWRVIIISKKVGTLLESNIITSLNEPCKISDVSWIKTGLTTFPWWYGTEVPNTIKGGNNFETNKYFIDFCSENNFMYHTVVEYAGHEWYKNDGGGYQPGPNCDVTKPVDGLDMKQICDYANSKDVGVRVWVHWAALYPKLDKAFALFEEWGISGMMVDFMDRDDQEMVNIQTEILEKAAKHHLHIQFHGSYKNTGLSRTYPNEFTREGTLNYEHMKWDADVTPNSDLDIAFTRLIAGSTDYHLGGFRAATEKSFKPRDHFPLVRGTRCHMLGMYVVLENEQGMACDDPRDYLGQNGFELLKQMPTTWDETKVVNAKMDSFISIARKKDNKWYVGTINNNNAKEVSLDFGFLPAGNFEAEVYTDDIESDDPNLLNKRTVTITNKSHMKIQLADGGGSVIVISI